MSPLQHPPFFRLNPFIQAVQSESAEAGKALLPQAEHPITAHLEHELVLLILKDPAEQTPLVMVGLVLEQKLPKELVKPVMHWALLSLVYELVESLTQLLLMTCP